MLRALQRRRKVATLMAGGGASAFDPDSLTWVRVYKSDGTLHSDNTCTTPQTGDGGVVGCWVDGSGNSNAVQATAGAKPTLQNAAGDLINGLPYILFDNTDDTLVFSNLVLSAYSIYIAGVPAEELDLGYTGATTQYLRIDQDNGGVATTLLSRHAGSLQSTNITKITAAIHVFSIIFNGTSVKWYVDGSMVATQPQTNALTINQLSMAATLAYTSRWVELRIANSAHDEATRQNMESYLSGRVGLA